MAQKSILLDKSLRFAAPLIPLLSWDLSPKYNIIIKLDQKNPTNRKNRVHRIFFVIVK